MPAADCTATRRFVATEVAISRCLDHRCTPSTSPAHAAGSPRCRRCLTSDSIAPTADSNAAPKSTSNATSPTSVLDRGLRLERLALGGPEQLGDHGHLRVGEPELRR